MSDVTWYCKVAAYCPECKSRLYPGDEEYMKEYGKCSYCVSWSKSSLNNEEV